MNKIYSYGGDVHSKNRTVVGWSCYETISYFSNHCNKPYVYPYVESSCEDCHRFCGQSCNILEFGYR